MNKGKVKFTEYTQITTFDRRGAITIEKKNRLIEINCR